MNILLPSFGINEACKLGTNCNSEFINQTSIKHTVTMEPGEKTEKAQSATNPPLIKRLGNYEFCLNQKLGSGLTGDAYMGVNTENSEPVCVKVVDRMAFSSETQQKMLDHEVKCQQLVKCENCVAIYDVFDTKDFSFIVTELCEGGDLYQTIRYSPNYLSEQIVKTFGFHIARALQNMKKVRIIHRDIKSENILIAKGVAKLGDFGFAIEEEKLKENKEPFNLGSPIYMSLEALQKNQYSYKSDVFSYGIVLYEMLHRVSPWESQTEHELKQRMKTQEIVFRQGLSETVKDLIRKCLARECESRINIEGVLAHEFFQDIKCQYKTENAVKDKLKEEQAQSRSPEGSRKSQSQETTEEDRKSEKEISSHEYLPEAVV